MKSTESNPKTNMFNKGVVTDDNLVTNSSIVSADRNMKWLVTDNFRITKPKEKNNVRLNTMYEEFHPEV